MCGCVNSRRRGATNVLKFGHTTAGTWPGTSGWAGVRPICCISAFFRAKWLRPFIKSWSFRCCGGWKYLHGGFSRLHRPWNKNHKMQFIRICYCNSIQSFVTARTLTFQLYSISSNDFTKQSTIHFQLSYRECNNYSRSQTSLL